MGQMLPTHHENLSLLMRRKRTLRQIRGCLEMTEYGTSFPIQDGKMFLKIPTRQTSKLPQ